MPADVVLLHGVGLDHTMWRRVAGPLSASAQRVHTPDLLGHGTASDADDGTTLADLAAPITGLVGSLPSPAHLVGFSLGALVATRVALDRPDEVASLTLVSGVADRRPEERAAVDRRLAAAESDLAATFDAAIDRWFSPRWRRAEPRLAAETRAVLAANRPASYLACYRIFAEADAEVWPELPDLVPPVLAITGADDPGSTPRMSAAVASRVPNGRSATVPGARHLLPLERPDMVTAAVLAQIETRTFAVAGETTS
ncbi:MULTISPECIES: alpha/beta fold hydrolase [Prauserella salsuginis group]|uniref:Alpha/beta fold hydrolase n=1 Tax=Prauserella salsuginis TaxID=387889 RepID=A0ABW6G7Z8_9PSEU|nr:MULTISPECIES: alpha/beta hydrolase [Prauserella salsuginis group]MCR3721708.1 Pimeloyl-ACP methyl ester carboxylesterase [Prauserella flava]MCR3734400.1 Pimeloyl-ACP methyl ester carboxylesterase [Prauserella salsuginis]